MKTCELFFLNFSSGALVFSDPSFHLPPTHHPYVEGSEVLGYIVVKLKSLNFEVVKTVFSILFLLFGEI